MISSEKQAEVKKAFRKYGRSRPGEVMFDEVQALLRDMRTFVSDEQLEGFVGMNFADLKRAQELSTPIGIDFENFQDLYLGLLDILERKEGKRTDVIGTLEEMRQSPAAMRDAFDQLDRGQK